MPNVDAMEKIVVQSVVDRDLEGCARKILAIDNQRRTRSFRNRDAESISSILCALDVKVREGMEPEETFLSPPGNRNAQDLRGVLSGRDIEIKCGPSDTFAALGVRTATFLMNRELFSLFPDKKNRDARRHIYIREGPDAARLHMGSTMQKFVDATGGQIELSPDNEKVLSLMIAGVTKQTDLWKWMKMDADSISIPGYDIVHISPAEQRGGLPTWNKTRTPPYLHGLRWECLVEMPVSSHRVTLKYVREDGAALKIVHHQKNSKEITLPGGEKVKTGYEFHLNSPSFNAWVTPPP